MKNLCRALSYIEFVLGTIGSIYLANKLGVNINLNRFNVERNPSLTATIFIVGMFSTIISWVILYAFSEILENQECMMRHLESFGKQTTSEVKPICGIPEFAKENKSQTVTTSSQTHMPAKTQQTASDSKDLEQYNSWKCPNCKRINDFSTSICACGTCRPDK